MKALTGIQPTNTLHIGNYFGALKPAVEMQCEYDLTMMIVDLHAITVDQDPKALRENILFAAATYLAAGIDPEKTVLFQQSAVSAHAELAWIMQTQTMMGEAKRMTQFKDKAGKNQDGVSVGLFTYPILMAADILAHQAEAVPVGEDQKQHLELARDIAERFNRKFGHTFTVPEPIIPKQGARIKSLKDPEKKMSKSDPSAKAYISIMDDEDVIAKKIRSAVTDSEPEITVEVRREGLYNLLTIYSLATGEDMHEIAGRYDGKGMRELKEDLAERLIHALLPIQGRIYEHLDNTANLERILANGAARAEVAAKQTLQAVYEAMGLRA